jgi:hypothetical protein
MKTVFWLLLVLGGSSSVALAADPELPEITLVPSCRDCVASERVGLTLGIVCPEGKPLKVRSSRLIFMDQHGDTLASIVDPYGDLGTIERGLSTPVTRSAALEEVLSSLAADSFAVVLQVNELYSNVVRFKVRQFMDTDAECQGSLDIELLVELDGRARANVFLAHFRNGSDRAISLPDLDANARVLVDELVDKKEYSLSIFLWIGLSNLWAGESWGTTVDLNYFINERHEKIGPGEHAIQYKFGDCVSNVIRIRVER